MLVGEKHSIVERRERQEELEKIRIEFGQLLRRERLSRTSYTISRLSEAVGVSAKYLSEIERGLKLPEDGLIKKLADAIGTCELELFKTAKRVPYSLRKELEEDVLLLEVMFKVINTAPRRRRKLFDKLMEIL
ncbi:helix-turn-helix domain-containing protein [Bacillus cereus group sp. BceL300]|uniref:helix-turn-helix domain-containing protein n=1 Tax=Bacillus cereus group sp. BceL300 TaxID=3444985 RepID=UPI003F286E17